GWRQGPVHAGDHVRHHPMALAETRAGKRDGQVGTNGGEAGGFPGEELIERSREAALALPSAIEVYTALLADDVGDVPSPGPPPCRAYRAREDVCMDQFRVAPFAKQPGDPQ